MRKTAIILSAVMLISTAVGCAPKEKVTEGNDVPVIKWYVPADKQKDMQTVMDEANKIVEPSIGAKLDLQTIDTGAYAEKMQMMMAAGEEFDLMFTGYINTYSQCVSRGGLLDITDLLAEQTPDFLETLPEYALNSAYVNGRIYAVPNLQVVATKKAIAVRSDLAKEYGLDYNSVKTGKDLEPFWDWILQNHDDVYPVRAINMGVTLPNDYVSVIDSYCVAQTDLFDGDDKLTVVREVDTEQAYNNTKQLHEWYKKGYIRNDVMTTSTDSADYSTGKYASFFVGWKPGFEENLKSMVSGEYDIIQLPQDIIAGASTATMIGVSRTCKNPELAVKFIELINKNKELYNIICFGVEGKHYNLDEEGKVVQIPDSGYDQKSGDWKFGNQFNALIRQGQENDIWEQTEALNNSAKINPIAGFIFDNSKVAAEVAAVQTVIDQYNVRMYGAQDPDEYWEEMMSKLESAGQQKIVEEMQRQIDEYMKNN